MNKKLITSVASILIAGAAFAQDYTIKANVKVDGLPPEYAAFGESEKTTTIKGEKTKIEIASMMASSTEVFDGKKMTVITEAMGNKSGWTATKEEMDKVKEEPKKDEVKPKVELTSEKKTIAGYECSKAVITAIEPKDKKEVKFIVWYTDKIKKVSSASSKKRKGGMGGGSIEFKEVPGYAMSTEFEMEAPGMGKIKYVETVSEVSTAGVDDSAFKISTDGYPMKTYTEYMEEMKKAMAAEK
ncbi:MAG: hypothetical protein K0S32_3080 [Bacteroidetes bacterium]|jgi:hypothetical protein|nr:hypothetical protein [Bacteroidota bacterium]